MTLMQKGSFWLQGEWGSENWRMYKGKKGGEWLSLHFFSIIKKKKYWLSWQSLAGLGLLAEVTNVQHCQFVWDYGSWPPWEEEEARRGVGGGARSSVLLGEAVWTAKSGLLLRVDGLGGRKGHWPLTLCIIRPMNWEHQEGPSLWREGSGTSGPRCSTIHPRVDKKQFERTRPRADNWDNYLL